MELKGRRKELSLGLVGATMVGGKWHGITWYQYFEFGISSSFTHRAMLPLLKHALFSSKYEKHASIIRNIVRRQLEYLFDCLANSVYSDCLKKNTKTAYTIFYVLVIIGCCRTLHKQTFNLHRCVILCRISGVWWERFSKILKAARELWSWNSIYVLWKECPSLERPSDSVEGLALGQLLHQMTSFSLVGPYDRI